MRTPQEILNKMDEVRSNGDFFGTKTSDLIDFLPYENAKPYLKEGVTEEQWNEHQAKSDYDSIVARILDYMPFAWEKANNCRGLSAQRSIDHFSIWLWMAGVETLSKEIQNFTNYGKPHLKKICEHFGWSWDQWHNGFSGSNECDQRPDTLAGV